jgi:acetamidase/formamidase
MAMKGFKVMEKRISKKNLKYEYSRQFKPVAYVEPGEEIVIETEDAYNGNLKTKEDIIKLIDSKALPPNPVTGPIYIERSRSGDILVINIDEIKIGNVGGTCFARTDSSNPINCWFGDDFAKVFKISNQKVIFSENLEIMTAPFIGCISTSPAYSSPSSLKVSQSGGNMDCCHIKPGSKIFLPVNVEGAFFYIGDVHALQGDGEFCGTAVEVSSEVKLHFDVIHNSTLNNKLNWPRVETNDLLTTIVGGVSLDDSFRVAMQEMLIWLETEYNLKRKEIFLELSQVANLRPCNRFTGRCELSKEFLQI